MIIFYVFIDFKKDFLKSTSLIFIPTKSQAKHLFYLLGFLNNCSFCFVLGVLNYQIRNMHIRKFNKFIKNKRLEEFKMYEPKETYEDYDNYKIIQDLNDDKEL